MHGSPRKELAHVIIKAEKSQDLQLAGWSPRRADGIVLVAVQRPGDHKSRWLKFQYENQQTRDSRRASVSVWVQRQEKGWCPSLMQSDKSSYYGRVSLFFCPGPQLTRWSPPTLRGSRLIQTWILEVPSLHTQRSVWSNVWTPLGPSKLTH